MHKEKFHNGKDLQGISSPQGTSDPVQMNSYVNLHVSPYYSSSHNTSYPCFYSKNQWSYVEVILVMSFINSKSKISNTDTLFSSLNKLNNFLSFYQSVSYKSMDDLKKLIRHIEQSNELDNFLTREKELADVIKFFLDTQYVNSISIDLGDITQAKEGNLLIKEHFYRERDYKIIRQKKNAVLAHEGALRCEACNFDYSKTYGTRGHNFIEVHHNKPISDYRSSDVTKLSDLSVLCSSCHRMIHRYHPWITIDELKKIIKQKTVT